MREIKPLRSTPPEDSSDKWSQSYSNITSVLLPKSAGGKMVLELRKKKIEPYVATIIGIRRKNSNAQK